MRLIGGGGGESTKILGILNLPWKGFKGKTFTKIEAHVGMAERLVIDLDIEEDLQGEIKHTLEQKISHMVTGVLYKTRTKTTTRLNLP